MAHPFPVPVVRMIVTNDAGQVLLLRRCADGHAGGEWCLPGGKVDYGQTVFAAVAAELREETSLEVTEAKLLTVQDSLPIKPGGMHGLNLYFACSAVGEVALNDESTEHAWVGPDDLDRYAIAFRNGEVLAEWFADRG